MCEITFQHLKIYKKQQISPSKISADLSSMGYQRVLQVCAEGEYALKGEVVDVFPYTFEFPVSVLWNFDEIERISAFDVLERNLLWDYELVILLPKSKSLKIKERASGQIFTYQFTDFQKGDYVVHTDYGIAKYIGIKKVALGVEEKDCLVLEYADKNILYVPIDEAHLVQKYIGLDKNVKVKLSKLGSSEWVRLKEKVKKGIYNMAIEMLKMQALRKSLRGFSFPRDDELQSEFENDFEYKETIDQKKAIEDVKRDMESSRPMDRLVCGEVGYGKTEVAVRAAFKAILAGKQVAVLVPTTLLAEQHYTTFSQRMEKFAVRVEMLSRFRSANEQRRIIEGLKLGQIDVIIGTHRLLSPDIKFKDLGLLIIDEEQKFGVIHKEKMKRFRTLVDVLTMTATPIPRTLYMALMGIKDMSIIKTPPRQRLAIKTKVIPFKQETIKKAIEFEVSRGGQVFFVHNRVLTIEKRAKWLRKLLPDIHIELAHGQMPSGKLESIMIEFIKGKIDVLVCTTIIESGIDIPNVNTLIVERADMFGLAELHQLRGRVGRSNRRAYAYFCLPPKGCFNDVARRRLIAIERYSDLGAGFKLAMEDLEIRGAGNILGTEQHGYITAVGFDLYCRLLSQITSELKLGFKHDKQLLFS